MRLGFLMKNDLGGTSYDITICCFSRVVSLYTSTSLYFSMLKQMKINRKKRLSSPSKREYRLSEYRHGEVLL